jgi:hypothetical protein
VEGKTSFRGGNPSRERHGGKLGFPYGCGGGSEDFSVRIHTEGNDVSILFISSHCALRSGGNVENGRKEKMEELVYTSRIVSCNVRCFFRTYCMELLKDLEICTYVFAPQL